MKRASSLLPLAALCGCGGNPSILDPAGPHAANIAGLFWIFMAVAVLVWLAVLGMLWFALRRGVAARAPQPQDDGKAAAWVAGSVALTTVVIGALVLAAYGTDRKLLGLSHNPVVEATVTGHQWWWEIRYEDGRTPSNIFTTANELHLPLGVPVKLTLNANDVIHSFWVPNIAGKRDLLPGRTETIYLQVDKPGRWRGRCGEFCGLQHSFMELVVVAEPAAQFQQWQARQRRPAATPAAFEAQQGEKLFTTGPCSVCHTVRGTSAAGHSSSAPDLTHLKSRQNIGAGAAPNQRGELLRWVRNPHALKPGVHMPAIAQSPQAISAIVSYLETLQ